MQRLATPAPGRPRPLPRGAPFRRARLALSMVAVLSMTACGEDPFHAVSGQAAEELGTLIDLQVLTYLQQNDVPGATVAVTKDGRLVLSKGYGVADVASSTQMQPWHRTRIGSVSKVITAIAMLQLVEQGQLGLDDPLYASSATPLWGSNPNEPPGVVSSPDGVLENAGDYLAAMTHAPANIPAPQTGGLAEPGKAWWWPPAYLTQETYQQNVEEILDWATEIRISHVLSHTAGFIRSGNTDIAAEMYGDEEGSDTEEGMAEEVADPELTYPQLHEAMMTGAGGPPLRFRPGTGREYSNHGFGLAGQIIAEISGSSYVEQTTAHVLAPLGLSNVVPRDIAGVYGALDSSAYAGDDPVLVENELLDEPTISVSTGGWTATAQDMARVMCGIDVESNNLRLLSHETAETMATVAYPQAKSDQPLGWDLRWGTPALSKDGSTPTGGGARITKYLPGGLDEAEINVAVATNKSGSPPISLLGDIAEVAAGADIPEDYDLFQNPYKCRVEPGLAAPVPSISPTPSPTGLAPAPTPSPTPSPTRLVVSSTPRPTPTATVTKAATRSPSPTPTPTPTPPPRVQITADTDEIWERGSSCRPTTTTVRATVTGGSDVRSARMTWEVGEETGSTAMQPDGPGRWEAELGPFPPGTVRGAAPVAVRVTVTDDAGRTASAEMEVTLNPCRG